MIDRDALSGMQAFVAVVEAGTIALAARRLRITPPALSKQLAKLEKRLGARLIERTTRSMRVTSQGESYLERARVALAAITHAEDATLDAHDAPRGPLRVSAPTLLGQELVAPIAARFLRAHPEVTLELDLTDRLVDVVRESVDVAVRIAARLPTGQPLRKLGAMPWVLVTSPAYLAGTRAPRHPEELASHRCLELAHGTDRGRWRFTVGEKPVRVAVHGPLVCSSLVGLLHAVREGLGIAQVPSYLVRTALERGELVRVLPRASLPVRRVHALLPSRTFLPSRTRAFIEALSRELPARMDGPG